MTPIAIIFLCIIGVLLAIIAITHFCFVLKKNKFKEKIGILKEDNEDYKDTCYNYNTLTRSMFDAYNKITAQVYRYRVIINDVVPHSRMYVPVYQLGKTAFYEDAKYFNTTDEVEKFIKDYYDKASDDTIKDIFILESNGSSWTPLETLHKGTKFHVDD